MMVLRIRPRTEFAAGGAVRVCDVADLYCDARRVRAQSLTISVPREKGIWLVDAGSIVTAIYREYPSEKVTVVGDTIGWITRRSERIIRRGIIDRICGGVASFVMGVMLYGSTQVTDKDAEKRREPRRRKEI